MEQPRTSATCPARLSPSAATRCSRGAPRRGRPSVQDASPTSADAAAAGSGRRPSAARPSAALGVRRRCRPGRRATRARAARYISIAAGQPGRARRGRRHDQVVGGRRAERAARRRRSRSVDAVELVAGHQRADEADGEHRPVARRTSSGSVVDPAADRRPRAARGAAPGWRARRGRRPGRRRRRPGRAGPRPPGRRPGRTTRWPGGAARRPRRGARRAGAPQHVGEQVVVAVPAAAGRRAGRGTGSAARATRASPCRPVRPVTASHSGPVSRSRMEVSSRKSRTSSGWRSQDLLDEVVDDVPVVAGEPGDEPATGRRGPAGTARRAAGRRPTPRCGPPGRRRRAASRSRPIDVVEVGGRLLAR